MIMTSLSVDGHDRKQNALVHAYYLETYFSDQIRKQNAQHFNFTVLLVGPAAD
jgi:hypothetical protein